MNLQTLRQPAFLSGYLPAYPHLLHTYPGAIGDGEYARRKRRSRRCRSFPVLHWHSLHRSRSALSSPVLCTVLVVAVVVVMVGMMVLCIVVGAYTYAVAVALRAGHLRPRRHGRCFAIDAIDGQVRVRFRRRQRGGRRLLVFQVGVECGGRLAQCV